MQGVFLLPPILEIPTGGNRYNEEVLRRLDPLRWRPVVWGQEDDRPWPADAVVLVDSLLATDPDTCAAVLARAGGRRKALLTHYLPQCDPSMRDTPPLPIGFDRFIVPSRFMAEALRRQGIPEADIAVVFPGTSRPAESPARLPSRAPLRILTVASLLPVKGILEAIDALAPLSNRDWLWDIVGDTTRDPAYTAAVCQHLRVTSMLDRTRLHGSRSAEDMPACFASAELLLAPSRFESLGMAIREAMAHGLPVVAHDVGGVPESVRHGVTGYLAPAGDVPALREGVCRLLDESDRRIQFGEAARETSRTFPDWEDAAAGIERHLGG